jgi:hypothetical protein
MLSRSVHGYLDMTYYEELEAAGHVLRRDEDGRVDNFVMEYGFHNGPGCVNCHDSWCEHCGDKIEPCIGKEAYEAEQKQYRYERYVELKKEFDV